MDGSRNAVYERVRAKLAGRLTDLQRSAPNDTIAKDRPALVEELRRLLHALPQDDYRTLKISRQGEEDRFLQVLIDETLGTYGPLDGLLADPTISEIMVNGPHQIFVERSGHLQRLELAFRDKAHLMAVIERMLNEVGCSVNESNPICDAQLPDGARLNVIIPPLVPEGPVITIRRKLRAWTMQEYITLETLSQEAAEFIEACVKTKVNMIFSGGTSTGKTTLASILSAAIPEHERIITIENVSELELPNRLHWIRMVGKGPNLEGRGEVPLRTLVRNALRMRPDRIILGEARGGEALDVVQAMHTGHDGVITLLHANSPQAAMERLETLMLMSGVELPPYACRMQIASAIDLIIHMGRFIDGSRHIAAISQVLGASRDGFQLEELFTFEVQGFAANGQLQGTCRYTGARPKFLAKFRMNNVEVPAWVTQ